MIKDQINLGVTELKSMTEVSGEFESHSVVAISIRR